MRRPHRFHLQLIKGEETKSHLTVIHCRSRQVSKNMSVRIEKRLLKSQLSNTKEKQEVAGTLMFVFWCLLIDKEIAGGSRFKTYHHTLNV